ncbi:MAG TPA: hypothetical protein VEK57_31900 [Thermoanaerobaculia bacterium]|nr:hypothetical protein [Thermoanaerobaculia bacterium]
MKRLIAVGLLALSLNAEDVADSRRLHQQALEARKAGDTKTFLEKLSAASALRPQHPTLLVQLAAALAANGREAEAAKMLDRVAAMGMVYQLEEPEFAKVPGLAALKERFAANGRTIGTAREELTVGRTALIPEGMAYDAKGKRVFVSSVRTKTIFAVDPAGKVTEFAKAPWGAFGMSVDAKRGVLWATTTAMPVVEGFSEEEKGKSALLRIDLRSGKVLETIAPPDGEAHQFGDVVVAPDGEVFISDSGAGVIYRLVGSTLEPWLRGPFVSLQGLAPGRAVIYAADYSKGIVAIDRRTRDVHALRVPPTASLLGVDGLYLADATTLVATQNGTYPNRVIRIRLAPSGMAVTSVETLLANAEGMADPTLGVIAGNRFLFNANAQWELFGDDGKIADPLKLEEAVVLSVPVR